MLALLIEMRGGNQRSREAKDAMWALSGCVRKQLPDLLCPKGKRKSKRKGE